MKTIFVETLGDSPQVKVLDFLIGFFAFDYSLIELSKNTKVSYSTLKYLLPKMLKRKLVIITKKVGKANLYKINVENRAVKHLMAFDWQMIKDDVLKNK